MMKFFTFSVVLILLVSIFSCSTKSRTKEKYLNSTNCTFVSDLYSDKKLYKEEFIYSKVKIGEDLFTVKIVRDKFSKDSIAYNFNTKNWWENESPSTLLIYDNSTCELIFSKKFDGVKLTLSKLKGKLSKDGNLYLHLISFGGGSGYISWLNKIEIINHRIEIQPIFDSNELSVILFDKQDEHVVLMNGIWDMSGWSEEEEGETHFSPHRFSVVKFKLNENNIEKDEIGTTKFKYDKDYKTEIEFLKELKQNEFDLQIKMNFNNCIVFNNWSGKFEN